MKKKPNTPSSEKKTPEMSLVHLPAKEPEDLANFLVERINAGDVEGLVALYESNATLACGGKNNAVGSEQIRPFYAALLSGNPQVTRGVQAPVRS